MPSEDTNPSNPEADRNLEPHALAVKVWHPVDQDDRYPTIRSFDVDALRAAPASRVLRVLAWLEERQHARLEEWANASLNAEAAATVVRTSRASLNHLMKDSNGNALRPTDKPARARDALAGVLGALDTDASLRGCERIVFSCADGELLLSLNVTTFFVRMTAGPTGPYVYTT